MEYSFARLRRRGRPKVRNDKGTMTQ
jgi:hypothetical protein